MLETACADGDGKRKPISTGSLTADSSQSTVLHLLTVAQPANAYRPGREAGGE